MKRYWLITLLVHATGSYAQNLVPNPSFETYTMCPSAVGGQIELAVPWTAATATSSTDYFNSCSGSSSAGVPYHQGGGFQYARTGNAYAGLLFTVGAGSGREYLQVQLTTSLLQNKVYYVEFYVNSANFAWATSGCNNIAANFSSTKPVATGTELPLVPYIINAGNPVIKDTMNWVKVSGCYTAQGGEQYLTIGNFFDNAHTQIDNGNGVSYYYVDDVLVEELTGACFTGLSDYSRSSFVNVYPNPGNGNFGISYNFAQAGHEFALYDIMGKEVKRFALADKEGTITMREAELVNGIYFYEIVDQTGKRVYADKLLVVE